MSAPTFDLVDLLRMPWDDGFAIHQPREIDLKAADEIERLRAEIKRLGPMGGECEPSHR